MEGSGPQSWAIRVEKPTFSENFLEAQNQTQADDQNQLASMN